MRITSALRIKTTMPTTEAATTEQAATVAEQGAHVAPEKTAPQKATAKAKAPKESKPKKAPKAPPTKEAGTLRADSKGAKFMDLICRTKGASLAELMKATGWQAHSVRGFISGTLGSKMGLNVTSAKREDGERVYSMDR
jgi:Protein of unknown function (DUF3489)